MRTDQTLVGRGLFGGDRRAHRSLSIHKVENGWKVEARFSVFSSAADHPELDGDRWSIEDREYVFYTSAEVVDFVRQYLDAKQEEIRG